MKRRDFLESMVGGSLVLLVATKVSAQLLTHGSRVALKCLGDVEGPRFLDGRTANGTVGLAPKLDRPFTGTKWQVARAGEGIIALKCLATTSAGWLDGRTGNGSVGLAPNTNKPFTGTRWQIIQLDENNPNIVALKCLGNIEGPGWLDGRTRDGTVGLAPRTDAPFSGTRWQVQAYPVIIDQG